MRKIKLTQGKVALVDNEDYLKLVKYNWYATKGYCTFYAQRGIVSDGKDNTIKMDHFIMSVPLGMEIDHRDGNGCNNQRYNLRICTRSQNQANSASYIGLSRYKGIHWCSKDRKWMSRIQVEGQRIYLGYFKSEENAALAYNVAAMKYFGDFARLNIIVKPLDRGLLLKKLKQFGI